MRLVDYAHVIRTVNKLIRDETGRPVIVQASSDKQPKYPFASYTVTSPNLVVSRARDPLSLVEDVEIVISITWHSTNNIEAMSLSQRTEQMLKRSDTVQKMSDAGIAVVKTMGNGSRDTFITIETERRYGFDLRVRTRSGAFNATPIDEIETIN